MRRASARENTSVDDSAHGQRVEPTTGSNKARILRRRSSSAVVAGITIGTAIAALTYWHTKHSRIFTAEELQAHDGTGGASIYLAVLGEVFDVTRGRKHYGKGGAYSVFAGTDASLAFVTGKFQSDRTDDVSSLTPEQLRSVFEWQNFYRKGYRWIGKLQGRYYDARGKPTAELAALVTKAGRDTREPKQAKPAPASTPCRKARGMLTCPEGSGYPRQVFQGAARVTCECFQSTMYSDQRRLYPGCAVEATACYDDESARISSR